MKLIASLAGIALIGTAHAALDSNAILAHIRKSFNVPAEIQLQVKDPHPSQISGFTSATVESSYQGRNQSQPIQISNDGRYYILGETYPLENSQIGGVLAPKTGEGAEAPGMLITSDKKHLLAGPIMEIKDRHPSTISGFTAATLENHQHPQSQPIQLSNDNRFYVLSDVYELTPAKAGGLLAPKATQEDSEIPPMYVSADGKFALTGEMKDAKSDPYASNMSKLKLDKSLSRGPSSAPIVFVEFSDLQCPYCKNAHQALEKELMETYGKKVRWVFKNFPLTNIHPWAYPAAIAATCAAKQSSEGAWKLQASLFDSQGEINAGNFKEKSAELAKKAGLDVAKFEACSANQETRPQVEADIEEAKAIRVNSTPTFIINGKMVAGFHDFASLKSTIDEMLADKGGKGKK